MGEKAYPDLASIPDPVDVVQVFRPPSDGRSIVEQALKIGAKVVWMQIGTTNPAAAKVGELAGLQVVRNRCMRVEHRRLVRRKFFLWG